MSRKIFKDSRGEPIKPGFYTERTEARLYYFDKPQLRTYQRKGFNDSVPGWVVFMEVINGLEKVFIDSTEDFSPANPEEVKKRIEGLRKKADWMEGKYNS